MERTTPLSFEATQPDPQQQAALVRQGRRLPRPYRPNHVPLAHRLVYACISLTWMTWALIGVVSGHMFFLVSRGGPIHFAGIPALVFCVAVLAGAAATSVSVVDHYDRRDNEALYRTVRRRLWWGALALLVAALGSACSPLNADAQATGLLAPQRLAGLLSFAWLDQRLRPLQLTLGWGMGITALVLFANFGLARLFGSDMRQGQATSPFTWVNLAAMWLFSLYFALAMLRSLVVGEFSAAARGGEALGAQVAWMHSMLLLSGVFAIYLPVALAVRLGQLLGLLPPNEADAPADSG